MIQIADNGLTVSINEKGAELQSIQLNGVEYLWQADAAFWSKHSPVLFPIVGELKDGKYFFKDREYKLSRHGFARDRMFTAEQTSSTSAVFSLKHDAESLPVYPFQFAFDVEYKISGAALFCTYRVSNTSDEDMYFSVGGHPAFNVPLAKDLQYTDYFLEFNNDETLARYLLHNGLTARDTEEIILKDKTLQLHPSLFYADAIVLKHIKSNEIRLFSEKDEHGLKIRFDNFPYFGIWASKDAPFVCLEPWCGIADNLYHNRQLIDKEGINKLARNSSWERTWSVELF